jgi:hypothetical protein
MSAITPIQGQQGFYKMDGKTYDLQSMLMAIGLERSTALEDQMVQQANAMKERNNRIKTLSGILAEVTAIKDSGTLYDASAKEVTDPATGQSVKVKDFLQSCGIGMLEAEKKYADGGNWIWGNDSTANEKGEGIEKIKATLDSLNSDSQMDMIRLQGLVSKRDQSFEMTTNLMKTVQQTGSAIIGNLR